MSAAVLGPRRLEWQDERTGFASGAAELDAWFVDCAWDAQRAGRAVTFVTTAGDTVLGFYALAMGTYATSALGQDAGARTPVVVLPRLAVAASAQGRGIGAAMLRHAVEQAFRISEEIGAAALVVHTPDASARAFYLANGDFVQSPVEPMHLMLSMAEIRRRTAVGSHELVVAVPRPREVIPSARARSPHLP